MEIEMSLFVGFTKIMFQFSTTRRSSGARCNSLFSGQTIGLSFPLSFFILFFLPFILSFSFFFLPPFLTFFLFFFSHLINIQYTKQAST